MNRKKPAFVALGEVFNREAGSRYGMNPTPNGTGVATNASLYPTTPLPTPGTSPAGQ